jgi:uncharacterized protein involved in response to NO
VGIDQCLQHGQNLPGHPPMKTVLQIEESDARSPQRPTFALWALGFRPLYLSASLYAALAVPLWALQFAGWVPGARAPAWHAHEMLFGYAVAIIVGFLFTAGRNWSGQPTPTGRALMALCALWAAGRLLVYTPWPLLAMVVNVAFPWAAAVALARALVAGNNRRNYFFVGILVALGAAQALAHAALAGWITLPSQVWLRFGLEIVLFVMVVMAGRVVPMFSNNGAPGTDARRVAWLEKAALGLVIAVVAAGVAGLRGNALAALLALTAVAHGARLALWHPWRTLRAPLVWVLHLAYGWVVLHFALRAMAEADWLASSVATHALTAGAIGTLTLGMMTRTARGHLGRPLKAEFTEVWIYGLVSAAALLRVLGPLAWPQGMAAEVAISGLLWSAAFALFAWRYGPWLLHTRIDGKPG